MVKEATARAVERAMRSAPELAKRVTQLLKRACLRPSRSACSRLHVLRWGGPERVDVGELGREPLEGRGRELYDFDKLLTRFEKEPHRADMLTLVYLSKACSGPLRDELGPKYLPLAQALGLRA